MHHTQIVAIDEKFGDKGPYDVFVISVQADRIWTCRRRYSRFYKLFLAFVSATGEAIDFPPKLFKRANGAQLEERRKRLDVFLSTLCAHPAPAVQSLLSEFLSHSGLRPSVHDLGVSFDVDLTTARSGDDVDVAVAARAGAGEVGGRHDELLRGPGTSLVPPAQCQVSGSDPADYNPEPDSASLQSQEAFSDSTSISSRGSGPGHSRTARARAARATAKLKLQCRGGTTATPHDTEEEKRRAAEIMRAFYAEHNPSRLPKVPQLIEKYADMLDQMIEALHEKYGVPYVAPKRDMIGSNTDEGAGAVADASAKVCIRDDTRGISGDVAGDTAGNTSGTHTGLVTGDVTGNTSGTHTGLVTGDVTGNTNGTHSGAVIGDVTDNTNGTYRGAVTGDVTDNTNGTHSSAVIGDVTDNTNGTHRGAVTGDVTDNTNGTHSGAVIGDVTGNTNGTHSGAVTGDVTGNTNGMHTAPVTGDVAGNTSGTHNSPVTGNATGAVDGTNACHENPCSKRQVRLPWAKCSSGNGLHGLSTPQAATADDVSVIDFDAAETVEGSKTHERATLTKCAARTSDERAKTQADLLTLALGEYSCACRCNGPRHCCVVS